MSRSSKRPPDLPPTRIMNAEDVRKLQKEAGVGEVEKLQADLEATRFALHREVEKNKELERRLGVAKEAVFVRHQRIAELEKRLKELSVECKRAGDLFARLVALTIVD